MHDLDDVKYSVPEGPSLTMRQITYHHVTLAQLFAHCWKIKA